MDSYDKILADLRDLDGPCRRMDCRIAYIRGDDNPDSPPHPAFRGHWRNHLRMEAAADREGVRVAPPAADLFDVPFYTADIEAVIAIDREIDLRLRRPERGPDFRARVTMPDDNRECDHATPVLAALCALFEIIARRVAR